MNAVTSTTTDAVARNAAMIYLSVAVFALVWTVTSLSTGAIPPAVISAVLAALLLYQAWSAQSMRQATITVDEAGIARSGRWGWRQPWERIGSARVDEWKSTPYLVVERRDASLPNHWSSSYLIGAPFPKNALVTPLDPAAVDDVGAAIAARGAGGGAGA